MKLRHIISEGSKMAKRSVKEDTMDDRLKTRLQQIAINNGAIATDYMGGSLFVKFAGQTAKLKADKTHVLIRQNVKHHYPDTGVNMSRVGDEFVYDFVPLASEKPDADHTNEGSRMPASMIRTKQKLDSMSPEEIRMFFKKREDFAAQHRGGKIEPGFSAKELAQRQEFSFGREFAKSRPYSRHFESTDLDEGLKDWLQRMAVAGIIVGSVAGIGSINNAINNNVPVIQAMNKALDVANQKGDAQLIQNIKQDIEVAKVSLDSGKNLNTVKNLQHRYAKFMPIDFKPSTPAPKFKETAHTNESEIVMSKDGFIQSLASKIVQPQKGLGKPEFDDRLLAKMYKLLTGHDVEIDGNKFTVHIDNKKENENFKNKIIKKIAQPIQDYNKKKEQEPKKS